MRIDHHFLGCPADEVVRTGGERFGQLDGLQVMLDGLLVLMGLAGGQAVAPQAMRPRGDDIGRLASFGQGAGVFEGLGMVAAGRQNLGQGQPIFEVVGLLLDDPLGRLHGLFQVARAKRQFGMQPARTRGVGRQFDGPFQIGDTIGKSVFEPDLHRSKNGCASTGSTTTWNTCGGFDFCTNPNITPRSG